VGNADLLRGVSRIALALVRFIVFDLDGTLVDSRRDLAESANQLLQECGAATHSEEAIGRMVGDGAATLVARAFAAAGQVQPTGALARFLEIYDRRLLRHTRTYDGVPELLDRLAGRFQIALLTNKPLDATQQVLDGLGIAHFFNDRVIGGDGPFPRKPDPSGLRHLMAVTTTEAAATLMVGDSRVDWETATAAGVRCALARYGFGFTGLQAEQLSGEELLLDRPLDLANHL
jgi:phosphoglycolate phosphatase